MRLFAFRIKSAKVYLSESDIENIFKKHDKNGDGRLCKKELKEAFDELGAIFTGYRANHGMSHADTNCDGFVDFNELGDLVKYAHKVGYTVN